MCIFTICTYPRSSLNKPEWDWTSLNKSDQDWTSMNTSEQVWTCLSAVLTFNIWRMDVFSLHHRTSMNKTEQDWTCLKEDGPWWIESIELLTGHWIARVSLLVRKALNCVDRDYTMTKSSKFCPKIVRHVFSTSDSIYDLESFRVIGDYCASLRVGMQDNQRAWTSDQTNIHMAFFSFWMLEIFDPNTSFYHL